MKILLFLYYAMIIVKLPRVSGTCKSDMIYTTFNTSTFLVFWLLAFLLLDDEAKKFAIRKYTNIKNCLDFKMNGDKKVLFRKVEAKQPKNHAKFNDIFIISLEWIMKCLQWQILLWPVVTILWPVSCYQVTQKTRIPSDSREKCGRYNLLSW